MFQKTYDLGYIEIASVQNVDTVAAERPVIIGLHGYLDNAESWSSLQPYFTGHQFVAIDWPGHGLSGHRPQGAHYHQLDYIYDLRALIESQKWQQVWLVGHSMGGILATLYASVYDDLLGVVSVDACGPFTGDVETSSEQIRHAIASRRKVEGASARSVVLASAVKARCLHSDMSPNIAEPILIRNIDFSDNTCGVWRSDLRLRTQSMLRLTEEQAQHLMQSINVSLCFILAENSALGMVERFYAREKWWKNKRLIKMSGGHHLHMENPEAVAKIIRDFVEQM